MVVGVCGCDGTVDSHAEACMLDVRWCTASSISVVVFSRTFKQVICNIDFWKFSQLMCECNGLLY